MSRRYKGRPTWRQLDRDYPYQVEIIIPKGGLGKRLDPMWAWARANYPDYVEIPANRYPVAAMRWCFKEPEGAVGFQAAFGGEIVPPQWTEK